MKWLAYLYTMLLFATYCKAQSGQYGKVHESLSMYSSILKSEVHYTIYLPYDYTTSQRRYPVVYLLHGYSDDDTGWLQFGEANRIANRAIAQGTIPPMILVMPDAKVTWYVNDASGENRYEDMLVKELIPFIDSTYRTRAQKRFRGVAGLSMGGFGALVLAMHYPELFSGCAAFSAAVWTDEQIINLSNYQSFYGNIFGDNLEGEKRINAHWKENHPLYLLETQPTEKLKSVRYLLDCGDDDFLTIGNAMLHIKMAEKKIPHEYRVRDGAHTWSYWRESLPLGLAFIGEQFR